MSEHRPFAQPAKAPFAPFLGKESLFSISGASRYPLYTIRVGTVRYSPYSKEPSISSTFGVVSASSEGVCGCDQYLLKNDLSQ